VPRLHETALAALLQRQKLPAQFGNDAYRPAYDGLSLPNVASAALSWLAPDAPALYDIPALPPVTPALLDNLDVTHAWDSWLGSGEINHVVILLMDALGYDQLVSLMDEGRAPGLAAATERENSFFIPLTSVYPSTTTNALTAVATGYPPAQHGVTATLVYMPEIGTIVNMIGHMPYIAPVRESYPDSQLNPDDLVPVPNIYQRFEASGVRAEIVNYYQFKNTSISRYTSAGSYAGMQYYHGYLTPSDGFATLRERLLHNSRKGRKSFTYAYVPNVDTAAHRYGPLTPSYKAEVSALDFALNREIFEPLAGHSDIAFLLVADHGQMQTSPNKVVWLEDHPDVAKNLLVPLHGESRAGHLFVKHGKEQTVIDYITQNMGENFLALPKAQAIEYGLYGQPGEPLGELCDDRIGDIVLTTKNGWVARQHVLSGARQLPYIGAHGGLSRAEMLIPFLATRL
jgi:hypothetical protein